MNNEYKIFLSNYLNKIERNELSEIEEMLLNEFIQKHIYTYKLGDQTESLLVKYLFTGWFIHEQLNIH